MQTTSQPPSRLRLAGTRSLAGGLLFVLAFGLALQQLARSNRPHELTRAPLVAALALVALVLLALALRHLWVHLNGASEERRPTWAWLLLPVLLAVALADAWLLLGAASSIPAVLAG